MSTMCENGRGGSEDHAAVASELAELDVTEKQLRYLEARFAGDDNTEAAEAAGVHRTTPYRWEEKPDFVAARRLLEQDRSERIVHRIHRLREESLIAVIERVKEGDAELALRALQVIGLDGPSPVDPVPAGVARDRAATQMKADRELAKL